MRIEWKTAGPESGLYHFIVEPGTGGRSWMNWDKLEVHLFSEVRVGSIAHEIGHVLGFPDHYYDVWHPERCEYMSQYHETDVMSDSSTGSVTADEWRALDHRYRWAE